jgi:hypothetical protein
MNGGLAVLGSEAHGLHNGTSALRGIPGLKENDRLIERWLRVLHPKMHKDTCSHEYCE